MNDITTNYCGQCGGLIMEQGNIYSTTIKMCYCVYKNTQVQRSFIYGWVCPVCHAGLSPHTIICPNTHTNTVTFTSDIPIKE